jgi:hypothetical protein
MFLQHLECIFHHATINFLCVSIYSNQRLENFVALFVGHILSKLLRFTLGRFFLHNYRVSDYELMQHTREEELF